MNSVATAKNSTTHRLWAMAARVYRLSRSVVSLSRHRSSGARPRLGLALLAGVISVSLSTEFALSRTWYIKADGSGDAPTIQAGIDSAVVGDVVLVAPGEYDDTLHVNIDGLAKVANAHLTKDITLRSELGGTSARIDGSQSDIGFLVTGVGSNAEIVGFEFTFTPMPGGGCVTLATNPVSVAHRAQAGPIGKAAIWCDNAACRITENVIHDAEADTGIHVKNSSVTITGNTIVAVGFGVNVEETADVLVSGNTFTNCAVAVSAFNSAPRVLDNIIQRVGAFACRGIECVSAGPANVYAPVITGNTIDGMQNEAVWCHTVSPVVTGNVVRNCYGVDFNYCGDVSFTGNLAVGNSHGVYLFGTPNGTVEGNTFDGNGVAVGVQEGSNPTIVRNIVYSGTVGIECTGLSVPVNPVISCNNVFGASGNLYSGTCADQTGVNGNFSADPEFCGIPGSGNYYLQSDSPCAPGNHPGGESCGTIGAFGIKCSTVTTKAATWGSVKNLFRKKGE